MILGLIAWGYLLSPDCAGAVGMQQLQTASFLHGTLPMATAEKVEGVDGNASHLIDQKQYDQIHNYFLQLIAATPGKRDKLWQLDFSSVRAYAAALNAHRESLSRMLGMVQVHPHPPQLTMLADANGVQVEEIRIALEGDSGMRALLFVPTAAGSKAAVIAIPGADESAEEFAGVVDGMETAEWLKQLLERGMVVAIPEMVERRSDHPLSAEAGGRDRRQMLWRLGFLVGRTLVGVEVEQVLALADYLATRAEVAPDKIAVWGEGQGGMTALYATALDRRLAGAVVQDYFQQREGCWREPVDRVLYGQLNEFGDAEVAALIAPRPLAVVTSSRRIKSDKVHPELRRTERFYQGLDAGEKLVSRKVASGAEVASAEQAAAIVGAEKRGAPVEVKIRFTRERTLAARNQHFEALYRYLRGLSDNSDQKRAAYWKLNSTPIAGREAKAAKLRQELLQLVGVVPGEKVPLHARTLLIGETDQFLTYEVLLDVFPGVEAYGHLLVPRSVAGRSERRLPAVVCQHGFGGAPKFVSGVGEGVEANDHFYHRFGERLAERGYVVFAPYLTVPVDPRPPGEKNRADLVNPLVREAAALGLMRTSMELAKLHRIVDFLQSLAFVDPGRIGYYGLSYGGYSATWMPPLEPRLRFTIISGHFNDWSRELTAEDQRGHYWSFPDEDFYNWNVLNRFSHVELVAAMWPRPVSIEWGLSDGTTTPEWHKKAADELKREYVGPWDMTDKVIFDDYIGPHTVHGVGTFSFIDRWLRPERSAERDWGCDGEHYCYRMLAAGGHGYKEDSWRESASQLLDSNEATAIRGRFYVSDLTPELTAFAVKIARAGHPGDLIVRLGTMESADDIAELRLRAADVDEGLGLWYELKLKGPKKLDPRRLYWFELRAEPGNTPQDGYLVYGPAPLGGTDYPHNFGLSFNTITSGKTEKSQ
jgi:dienelactone hydrolase